MIGPGLNTQQMIKSLIAMKKDALVSDVTARKFAKEKETPYTRWAEKEGLDIIDGIYVPDLNTVELKPWVRRNGYGLFINHDASRTSNDCYVCEIGPGDELVVQRQLYEEMIMILSGRGSTSVWNDAGQKVSFEWQAGAMFSIPLNTWHQHFNGSGEEKVRFVAVTNLAPILNVFEEPEFIFNTAHDFKNRFSGEPDYFASKDKVSGLLLETNFVADVVNLPLIEAKERGAGGGHIRFNLAKSSMNTHISQFPVGTYKKAHAHGPGAHVIILAGEGYSLMWSEGEEPKQYEWKPGTLITPEHVVPPALQQRHYACTLPCIQIRRCRDSKCPGCSQSLDQSANRGSPD
jgi:oxalate decarboxylase/phosphoglucose isomerase-like protein (cupin superfamily)